MPEAGESGGATALQFRDVEKGQALMRRLEQLVRGRESEPVQVMHVCGSHEQAIARFGLRSVLPPGLRVTMGPGCPVCVTDAPEIDEAVALARAGVRVATYGDMLRVPGSQASLEDARSEGAAVEVVYSVTQAAALAEETGEEVVFFASGFETTAVATAAVLLRDPPRRFSVLSAHKYIPPVMEIVAEMPDSRVQGFLAAGHAATITGWGVFQPFVRRHGIPVVVAGFEPLDILAGFVRLAELAIDETPRVENLFPRMVTREGNKRALEMLWRAFEPVGGWWRGISRVPNGNLRLRRELREWDARARYGDLGTSGSPELRALEKQVCCCGEILAGTASPTDCPLFGNDCSPAEPRGACMVSSEGACRIWHEYGGAPNLEVRR